MLLIKVPEYYSHPILLTDYLINDEIIDYWNITIGEQIDCLGFPLCVSDSIGCFPILRTGKIASYPLIPSDVYASYYYDFEIYKGNSGGPVIFQVPQSQARITKDHTFAIGEGYIQFIMGLVTQTIYINEQDKSGNSIKKTEIKLGSVIQARYIIETLNMLP